MDVDGDGAVDVLSGSYSRLDRDMAGLFQVLQGNKDHSFRKAEVLCGSDGKPLILPVGANGGDAQTNRICTRAFACDLNGDGKLDLISGNFCGTFGWFRGEGRGRFAPQAQWLLAGDDKMNVSMHSDPFLCDWDGDGALDLLSGSGEGGVFLFRNVGARTDPRFAPSITLLEPPNLDGSQSDEPMFGDAHLKAPATATRVWADDVDGDGRLDLLVGDQVTLLHLADGVDAASATAKWKALIQRQEALFESANADPEAFKRDYDALQKEKASLVREEVTGHVWLLRQK